jgi:hypothetical protein
LAKLIYSALASLDGYVAEEPRSCSLPWLVDRCHLFLALVIVGGGTRALPGGQHLGLELLDERRFRGGTVHLHYRNAANG